MSDYSFMKTGHSNLKSPEKISEKNKEDIEEILCLFTNNALLNAVKYVELCNRNGVTKKDIEYGLKYEVFEFLQRPNLINDLHTIKQEYENLNNCECECECNCLEEDCICECDENCELYHNEKLLESLICKDEDIDTFMRINEEYIDDTNKEFINKIHKYYDNWDSWKPQNSLEKIIKKALDNI